MSEYFGVSLDYLMRGTESDKCSQDTTINYKAKSLLMIWNSFVSNLSDTQRKLVMVLYVLLICVCVAIIISFIYGVGYVIGQTIGHMLN